MDFLPKMSLSISISISIFSKMTLSISISISIFSRMSLSISISISIFLWMSLSISISISIFSRVTLSISISISIFSKRVDISIIDIAYRYIEHPYSQEKSKKNQSIQQQPGRAVCLCIQLWWNWFISWDPWRWPQARPILGARRRRHLEWDKQAKQEGEEVWQEVPWSWPASPSAGCCF